MNPDAPLNPREETELRLTALLMGQLPPDEAAALEAQIAADPALAALHARLRHAAELLREATALPEPAAAPVPARLSDERRERLLAHFKTIAAPIVPVKPQRDWSWVLPLGLAATVIALLGGTVLMNGFIGGKASFAGGADYFDLSDSEPASDAAENRHWSMQPGAIPKTPVARNGSVREFEGFINYGSPIQTPPASAPEAASRGSVTVTSGATFLNGESDGEEKNQRLGRLTGMAAGAKPASGPVANTVSVPSLSSITVPLAPALPPSDPAAPAARPMLELASAGDVSRAKESPADKNMPDAMADPLVTSVKSELAKANAELAETKAFVDVLARHGKTSGEAMPLPAELGLTASSMAGGAGGGGGMSAPFPTAGKASLRSDFQDELRLADGGVATSAPPTFLRSDTGLAPVVKSAPFPPPMPAPARKPAASSPARPAPDADVFQDATSNFTATAAEAAAARVPVLGDLPVAGRLFGGQGVPAIHQPAPAPAGAETLAAESASDFFLATREKALAGKAGDRMRDLGSVTLNGAATYSGVTTVTGGTLAIEATKNPAAWFGEVVDGSKKQVADLNGRLGRGEAGNGGKADQSLFFNAENESAKAGDGLAVVPAPAADLEFVSKTDAPGATPTPTPLAIESGGLVTYDRLQSALANPTTAMPGGGAAGNLAVTGTGSVELKGVKAPDGTVVLEKSLGGRAQGRAEQAWDFSTEAVEFSDSGRYDLAQKRAGQALAADPRNAVARELQEKFSAAKDDSSIASYNETRSRAVRAKDYAWAEEDRPVSGPADAKKPASGGKNAEQPARNYKAIDEMLFERAKEKPEQSVGGVILQQAGPDPIRRLAAESLKDGKIGELLARRGYRVQPSDASAPTGAEKAMELAKLKVADAPEMPKLPEEKLAKLADEDSLARRQAVPAQPAPVPQPEVATRANAFSTFSLNVSDVAFKLAAASLEKGQMPELATVRSEEFINAFDYHDPEPAGDMPLACTTERARYPFAQNRDLFRCSVKTAAAGRQPGRPLNLVLLLDNSGSMERADRVGILREALRVLSAQLQPQDKLSVVTFARTPRLWADGVPGDQAAEKCARVGEITPQGGTNLAAALDLGYATALRHYQPGSINRVVLLTDGAANLGDVNPDALKQKVEAHRKQGVALDCFGIGWEGYDDTVLEALSRNGDGRYGFINSPEEAATEFAGQLAGALRVAASDVKVQIEWNPRRVTAWRQIGYAKHQLKKEQFRDNTVDAAEIGAAESGNALYVCEVNPRGEGDLATVRVRFKVPGTSDYKEHEWPVPYTKDAPPLEQASPALRLAGTASAFSEWLVGSQYASEVTPDRLLGLLNGVPAIYRADPRPQKLEWMIRTAKSVSGR